MELWEVEFTSTQIANVVGHNRTGVSGEGQLDEMIVALVGQIRAPEIIHFHPDANRENGLKKRLALRRWDRAFFHDIGPV